MNDTRDSLDLSGKLLIAMPGMGDPRFDKAVIYVCAHSEEGAMGLMVNKPLDDLSFGDLLEQLSIAHDDDVNRQIRVHLGGPVEHGRGFVLHSGDYRASDSTLQVDGRFSMTATLDILEDIARGAGPRQSLLALGYAGWGPEQLDNEFLGNGWLSCDASAELIFDSDDNTKWARALATIGVDPQTLSGVAGRA